LTYRQSGRNFARYTAARLPRNTLTRLAGKLAPGAALRSLTPVLRLAAPGGKPGLRTIATHRNGESGLSRNTVRHYRPRFRGNAGAPVPAPAVPKVRAVTS
jgi:hypothetical protein